MLIKNYYKTLFYIFLLSHLIIWTIIPSLSNVNLPLDTIEALAWGSNLSWGYSKHPPVSAFFAEVTYNFFGNRDWAYYLLSQIFVVIAFIYVWKFSNLIFKNKLHSLCSIFLLEGIYFYNFTSPEFNVNVCQLPFWATVIYYSWKSINYEKISDLILLGLFMSIGFLTKYLFIYLLLSIKIIFILIMLEKRNFKMRFLIPGVVFVIFLTPHVIWLFNNEFVTITYALNRTGIEELSLINHIYNPLVFLLKQVGILSPVIIMLLTFINLKKLNFKILKKDKYFLLLINLLPIILIFLTSLISGAKIRTMWMTPFYLFIGLLVIYLFKTQINFKKINNFSYCFLFLFLFSPFLYGYISITKDDKRTDYPGKQIGEKVQYEWDQNFDEPIGFVIGNEWNAGNLSYHLKSRPKWEGFVEGNNILNEAKEYICIDDICVGTYK